MSTRLRTFTSSPRRLPAGRPGAGARRCRRRSTRCCALSIERRPPGARELYDDLEDRQAAAVASLRAFAGPDVDDAQLTELVGELSVKSPEFRRLWSRHDVKPIHGALPPMRIHHPQLGPIDLCHQKLEIPEAGGQILGLLYAEPGSKSEQAVAMLAATMGETKAARATARRAESVSPRAAGAGRRSA